MLMVLPILATASCSSEDDVEDIFTSHTWYVTNIYSTASKTSAVTDITALYKTNSYYVKFASNGTLSGMSSQNREFSGTWSANGTSRTLSITINGSGNDATSKLLLKALSEAGSYAGDNNVLTIYPEGNGQYYVTLGSKAK